ncbi:hypothetical protein JA1_005353 [Spathaspora sp. JA1]|nr:hypothetical protein JA1_005353 [Spathaspora sp. JA1]
MDSDQLKSYQAFLKHRSIRRVPRHRCCASEYLGRSITTTPQVNSGNNSDNNTFNVSTVPIRSRALSDGNMRITTATTASPTSDRRRSSGGAGAAVFSPGSGNTLSSVDGLERGEEEEVDEALLERIVDAFGEVVEDEPLRFISLIRQISEDEEDSEDDNSSIDEQARIDFFGNEPDDDIDADMFYTLRRDSFNDNPVENVEYLEDEDSKVISQIDRDYEYVLIKEDLTSLPRQHSQDYLKWEFPPDYIKQQDPSLSGYGIKPTKNINFATLESSDPSTILQNAPGEKFHNSLSLKYLGIKKLYTVEIMTKYKNNLTTLIKNRDTGLEYLVIASNSEIVIFQFDQISQLPDKRAVIRFDTKPSFTSSTDRLISTWPYFPHSLNFIKSFDNFNGKQIVGACSDDGTLLVWYSDTIISYISKFSINTKTVDVQPGEDDGYRDENRFHGLKVKPDFKIKMEASLWGLDFINYVDLQGESHNLIVASDNSQSIGLFYYHVRDQRFYHIKTHHILHNIPEVSFVNVEFQGSNHIIDVSCGSISGELIIFQFKFKLVEGPLDLDEFEYFKSEQLYYVDSKMEQLENRNGIDPNDVTYQRLKSKRFNRIIWSMPKVISRCVLNEDCWTIKPVESRWFLPVASLAAVFGDDSINEQEQRNNILHESKLLGLESGNVKYTSDFGGASNFQFFESKITSLDPNPPSTQDVSVDSVKLTLIDDEYRRIHKEFIQAVAPSKFLLISTSKKLGMLHYPSLYCNCATKRIFDLPIPFHERSKFSNRISITEIIPKLSCLIAVSQQGLVTIMRLCKHGGVYGMRQEYLFPNALSLALGYHGYRTITGLAIRDKSLGDVARYLIYLSYSDGIIVGYQLTLNDIDEVEIEGI